ncbi:hypothetical protein SETIT_2G300200v2 [Setaria italica]|uniref:Uncharacterized protein n=1 Tax=Setaria italica TaxID=4555 RepID=A0A368Q4S0_SETIT|nr:hypothetical protein SETIT_2G300200v2 [Setaria italica]
MSDDVAIGVVLSLEASSLETHLGLLHSWFISHGRPQPVATISPCGKLDGWCRGHVEAIAVMVVARADHIGWHCLATVSAAWDCVGGRRFRQRHCGTNRLSGSRRVAQLGWTTWCGTSSEDGASDFSSLLT